MRMSCNGCRVLRKGCSDNCSIRPCLQWIKNPESQANATVFLAKFYGRAGLMNLINAGPEHHRPAIFRSLLYEACGRIVNPISGSVGLLRSGSWQMCQAAVEAVLKGTPIVQIPTESAANTPSLPLKAYDIRHVSKDEPATVTSAAGVSPELHKVAKPSRTRFKRSAPSGNPGFLCWKPKVPNDVGSAPGAEEGKEPTDTDDNKEDVKSPLRNLLWHRCYPVDSQKLTSHESSEASHQEVEDERKRNAKEKAESSTFSDETADASMVTAEKEKCLDGEVELELTLGFQPASHSRTSSGGSATATALPTVPALRLP